MDWKQAAYQPWPRMGVREHNKRYTYMYTYRSLIIVFKRCVCVCMCWERGRYGC